MEPNSPRKIQFTVPLLEPHLDPEAAEQIRRRRPTPANLVLSSDQSSPEIDEDRLPNPLLKSGLAMSPRQRKKVSRTTPTMKELQMMVEHHLCKQAQGEEEEEEAAATAASQEHGPGCCHHGDSVTHEHSHSPGGARYPKVIPTLKYFPVVFSTPSIIPAGTVPRSHRDSEQNAPTMWPRVGVCTTASRGPGIGSLHAHPFRGLLALPKGFAQHPAYQGGL
nr:LOW QUALITY PROTEIN: protein phosphatase 1 regulatory subunit 1A [Anas platyrhynchos]